MQHKNKEKMNYPLISEYIEAIKSKPGFLFHKETLEDGISIYEYYPLAGMDIKFLSYKTQIKEILEAHERNAKEYRFLGGVSYDGGGIGNNGVLFAV